MGYKTQNFMLIIDLSEKLRKIHGKKGMSKIVR